MLPSLWRVLSCHRHGWGPALYHDHHLCSRWTRSQPWKWRNGGPVPGSSCVTWRSPVWFVICPGRRVGAYHRRHDGQEGGQNSEVVPENYRRPGDESRVSRLLPFILEDQDWQVPGSLRDHHLCGQGVVRHQGPGCVHDHLHQELRGQKVLWREYNGSSVPVWLNKKEAKRLP